MLSLNIHRGTDCVMSAAGSLQEGAVLLHQDEVQGMIGAADQSPYT